MNELLIKMIDGGLVKYDDDCYNISGCPTCDYGSEYITEIYITLTHYRISIETNQMYEYAISEGQMIRLFLSEYNNIEKMTEKEFIDWFKEKLCEIIGDPDILEKFEVTEIKE